MVLEPPEREESWRLSVEVRQAAQFGQTGRLKRRNDLISKLTSEIF